MDAQPSDAGGPRGRSLARSLWAAAGEHGPPCGFFCHIRLPAFGPTTTGWHIEVFLFHLPLVEICAIRWAIRSLSSSSGSHRTLFHLASPLTRAPVGGVRAMRGWNGRWRGVGEPPLARSPVGGMVIETADVRVSNFRGSNSHRP